MEILVAAVVLAAGMVALWLLDRIYRLRLDGDDRAPNRPLPLEQPYRFENGSLYRPTPPPPFIPDQGFDGPA